MSKIVLSLWKIKTKLQCVERKKSNERTWKFREEKIRVFLRETNVGRREFEFNRTELPNLLVSIRYVIRFILEQRFSIEISEKFESV